MRECRQDLLMNSFYLASRRGLPFWTKFEALREMEITRGWERIELRRIDMLQLLTSPPLLLLLTLVLVFLRENLCRGDVTVQMWHHDLPPGVGRQMMARPLLVHPHDVQPGETPSAGTAGKLLLHPALVAPMPVQGVLDQITSVAAWATIPENRLWNTGVGPSPLSREHTTAKVRLSIHRGLPSRGITREWLNLNYNRDRFCLRLVESWLQIVMKIGDCKEWAKIFKS